MLGIKDILERKAFECYSYSIKLCLVFREKIKNKNIRKLAYILMLPVLLVRWGVGIVGERTIGVYLQKKRKIQTEATKFENDLAIVAIAKNEAPYIREWIEFHKLVGVTRFYIYDNESTDGLKECLQDYIDRGLVVYTYFPGESMQLVAYNDALRKFENQCKYMAFVDLDEFICPVDKNQKISTILDEILMQETHAGGVGVTWRIFGSSGYQSKPEGLVIENYLHRGNDDIWQNYHIKTICNPRMVKQVISPHFPIYKIGAWNINENGVRLHGWYPLGQCYSKIKLNHYFCKSREEALAKWNRGLADRTERYDWTKFEQYDLNEIYDDDMLVYVDEIKNSLSLSKEE